MRENWKEYMETILRNLAIKRNKEIASKLEEDKESGVDFLKDARELKMIHREYFDEARKRGRISEEISSSR